METPCVKQERDTLVKYRMGPVLLILSPRSTEPSGSQKAQSENHCTEIFSRADTLDSLWLPVVLVGFKDRTMTEPCSPKKQHLWKEKIIVRYIMNIKCLVYIQEQCCLLESYLILIIILLSIGTTIIFVSWMRKSKHRSVKRLAKVR